MRDGELPFAVDNLRFFAAAARSLDGTAAGVVSDGYTSMLLRRPVGVVAAITPWNFPLVMAVWKVGAALAAGCSVVLKPAPATPSTSMRLAELAARGRRARRRVQRRHRRRRGRRGAGRRPARRHGHGHRLDGDRAAGDGQRRGTARRECTSSSAARRRSSCSPTPTSPAVAAAAALAATYNTGQDCTAATRVYAEAPIADELVDADARRRWTRIRLGGPVRRGRHRSADLAGAPRAGQRLRRAGAGRRRARSCAAAGRRRSSGWFYEPTLVTATRAGRARSSRTRCSGRCSPCCRSPVRGRGRRPGQRHGLRPGVVGVDTAGRPRAARRPPHRGRRHVDQRPPADRQRDAPRRSAVVWLRQGHGPRLGARVHRRAPRDGQARRAGATQRLPAGMTRPGCARPPSPGGVAADARGRRSDERPITVDQTNHSVVVGEAVVVKWLRSPGAAAAPRRPVARPPRRCRVRRDAGVPRGARGRRLGRRRCVTAYVAGSHDGWEWYVDELTADFERGDTAPPIATATRIGALAARLHVERWRRRRRSSPNRASSHCADEYRPRQRRLLDEARAGDAWRRRRAAGGARRPPRRRHRDPRRRRSDRHPADPRRSPRRPDAARRRDGEIVVTDFDGDPCHAAGRAGRRRCRAALSDGRPRRPSCRASTTSPGSSPMATGSRRAGRSTFVAAATRPGRRGVRRDWRPSTPRCSTAAGDPGAPRAGLRRLRSCPAGATCPTLRWPRCTR